MQNYTDNKLAFPFYKSEKSDSITDLTNRSINDGIELRQLRQSLLTSDR